VRRFKTFTTDLRQLADWLATFVSRLSRWRPLAFTGSRSTRSRRAGFEGNLGQCRHIKNVRDEDRRRGRQWIQELHSFGLLRGKLRPSAEIATLRAYLRIARRCSKTRETTFVACKKALVQITPAPQRHQRHHRRDGPAHPGDIVAGVTDPKVLASHVTVDVRPRSRRSRPRSPKLSPRACLRPAHTWNSTMHISVRSERATLRSRRSSRAGLKAG